nr:nuclease-related domain-containing protein [Lederbergia citrisecunda]
MVVSIEESKHLTRLEKGFEGELLFDERIDKSSKEWLILNDLQLKSNNTEFQIDSFLITQKTIFLFEIKNYEGDYYIEGDKWYYTNGTEIQNPLTQLERSEFLIRRLLQELGYSMPVESFIIYINPDFHLYNAPRNLPIVYPTQLNRFFEKLNNIPTKVTEYHKRLAKKLISLHKDESTFTKLPKYSYEELQKGIMCVFCYSFDIIAIKRAVKCKSCDKIEDKTIAIIRSVDEYVLLFPDRKITTNDIYEWCNGIVSKKSIQRILIKNFILKGNAKSTYYIRK